MSGLVRSTALGPPVLAVVGACMAFLFLSPLFFPSPAVTVLLLALAVGGPFLVVGGVILVRAAWHRIGWLLVGTGVLFSVGMSDLPFLPPWFGPWSGPWIWVAGFAVFAYTTLVFPSGRLPSGTGTWPAMARAAVVVLLVSVVSTAFVRVSWGSESGVIIPFGFLPSWVGPAGAAGVILVMLGAAVSLVTRLRRSSGEERAQLAWVVASLALIAVGVTAVVTYVLVTERLGRPYPGDGIWAVPSLTFPTLPVAFLVAVTRYRLYGIDRLISRTLTYAVVVGVLVTVYTGGVLVLRGLLRAEGDLAVAASTLAVAALFNPLRRRVQDRVERQFNRSRYDAERELERFANRLRDELDLGGLTHGLLAVVGDTVRPSKVTLWIAKDVAERP